MWSHREDEITVRDDGARELARAVTAEIEATLHADEQRAIRRGGAIPGARAGAADLDLGQAALDRDFARDRFRERTTAGVAGADEEELHVLTRLR